MAKSKPKENQKTTLADELRNAIADSGETVTAIAKGAGVAQPVLHRFAKGERDLTLTTAQRLIDYFDLELRPRKRGK